MRYSSITSPRKDPTSPHFGRRGPGDADLFSCPAGSTNTVFEHVFYTGTTNAPFAYPQPTAETAVLEVTASGTGSGELVVGDKVVPLVPRPRPRLLMGANGAFVVPSRSGPPGTVTRRR